MSTVHDRLSAIRERVNANETWLEKVGPNAIFTMPGSGGLRDGALVATSKNVQQGVDDKRYLLSLVERLMHPITAMEAIKAARAMGGRYPVEPAELFNAVLAQRAEEVTPS